MQSLKKIHAWAQMQVPLTSKSSYICHLQTVYIQIRHDSCFVCLVALSPKSTAMVMAGQSVHLTTLFPGQA